MKVCQLIILEYSDLSLIKIHKTIVGIMDADSDLGGKFSDESDSFVGWNSTREEMGIRREQETGQDIHLLHFYTIFTYTPSPFWERYTPSQHLLLLFRCARISSTGQ